MDKLTFELRSLATRNRDGSRATQANRIKHLSLISSQLKKMGYRDMSATSLKTKHVNALVEFWKTEKSETTGKLISPGTMKNRLSNLRWWASKVNKQNVIPRSNKDLGVDDRQRLPSYNKAYSLASVDTVGFPRHLLFSLRLQEQFGLRREEAAKITVGTSVVGGRLVLKSSWTKGGRARSIPITNDAQRSLLDEIKKEFGTSSLIPSNLSYRDYLNHRDYYLRQYGIRNTHGLRHHYAQVRYQEISGLVPPRLGGPSFRDLNDSQRELDIQARSTVSSELGHGRIEVTRIYLG